MALESPTYISDFVSTNPVSGDPKSQGDDHIRNMKAAIKATFPAVTGAVTPTHTELNFVDGVTSAIQGQIDALVLGSYPALVLTNVTGNTTLTSNRAYSYNTAGLTLTLPASPANGDKITIFNMGTNVDCIVGRNARNIMGSAADMTINLPNCAVTLIYVNSNAQADWRIV